jgi:ABC-type multidrug transport system fused ATPase/permease subunit
MIFLSFFNLQGRILNRFGKDVDVLDTTMAMLIRGWITCLLAVISTFLIISYTTPLFLVPIAVVMCCYYFVQRIYVATSRQLKRLESVTKSPIFSHFGETLNGAATIRAFSLQTEFIKRSERLVDDNQKANYPAIVANRWLAVRLEMVGNLIIFCSALLAVLGKDSLTPGLVGLSVSYALSVTQTLNWLVRMTSELETNIVAVERLKEYSETKCEAKWELESDKKNSKIGLQMPVLNSRMSTPDIGKDCPWFSKICHLQLKLDKKLELWVELELENHQ